MSATCSFYLLTHDGAKIPVYFWLPERQLPSVQVQLVISITMIETTDVISSLDFIIVVNDVSRDRSIFLSSIFHIL